MSGPEDAVSVRRATPDDAPGIVRVLRVVVDERIFSAIDEVWSVDQERQFLSSLSPREAVHVAVDVTGAIVGLQIVDRWSPLLRSTAHVGQVGTFLLPERRQQGIGARLWDATLAFARGVGYRKLVIQVRASNWTALRFYARLGFVECGRLRGQVVIDGKEDDEVILERSV
jgi:ribosomal protein S18 acetylase RimI-like enzyme